MEPAFIDQLNRDGRPSSDRTTIEYSNALSKYANNFCDTYGQDGKMTSEQIDQIKLIANAPLFLHNKVEISYYDTERKKRWLSDEEWKYYQDFKPYMIWYNQLLADYAYDNPQAKLSDMNKGLTEQSLSSFPGQTDMVEMYIKQATRGARTEAASRQLLDLTDIDYSPGTIEDDLRGGDLIVYYQGMRIKVDIKSSLSEIVKIQGGYGKIDNELSSYAILKKRSDHDDVERHVVVLFPGFSDADLGDSLGLQLPAEQMQQRANLMATQLRSAHKDLQKEKQRLLHLH